MLSADPVRVGLTTAIDSEQDKPKILHCIDARRKNYAAMVKLQNNSDSTTDDEMMMIMRMMMMKMITTWLLVGLARNNLTLKLLRAEPKDINLTSNPSSERCISVNKLLEEQHRRWWDFYKAFKRTRRSDLKSFYQFYDIPINRRHHMCVLWHGNNVTYCGNFPYFGTLFIYVSCEEQVISLRDYIETSEELGGLNSPLANVEKEHAMVAMKLNYADVMVL
ncbi:hypothetical protein CVS40_8679 [Lucilia cuprina]|nr:hypothetical protein CVS40_8679 [Lucilia cuprina]